MKKVFTVALFAGIFIAAMPTLATASPLQDYYDDGPVSYQTFYDELSPYGQWIDDPEYGYVWQPNAGADFRPYYTNGNWAYTTYGWTWVSSYNWGWAPFHYGRWRMDPFYGWVWIPGYEWGPAWVSWRNNAATCGWAPLGPGISISMSISSGFAVPVNHWVFLETRWLGHRSFYNHCAPFRQNNVYYNNTVIVNNTYVYNRRTYINGPDAGYYRRSTGRTLSPASVRSERRPGMDRQERGSVRMYRPEVRQYASNSGAGSTRPTPAPSRVISRNEAGRPGNDRNNGNWSRNNDNNNRPNDRNDRNNQRSFDNQFSRDNDRNGVTENRGNRNNLPDRTFDRNNNNNTPDRTTDRNRNNLPDRTFDRNNNSNTPEVRDNRNNVPDRTIDRNRNNLPDRTIDRSNNARENRENPWNNNRSATPDNNRSNTFERSRPAERNIPQRQPQTEQRRAMPEQRQQQEQRSRVIDQPRQSSPNRSFERQQPQRSEQPRQQSGNSDRGGRRGTRES
ncbi:DUF6600 domain-containing protein [uncultured Chitinophaga sp.]|uniref:DUF6600 domain-containing protein n=1 Tax=uncultured Chitinophaga sp. TaxID=339340 RepID=UPI0025F2E6F9|nr:DUF6600 domain-containing protein [uncultured Chitinophaga sp.]